jgi:hypothetical protein
MVASVFTYLNTVFKSYSTRQNMKKYEKFDIEQIDGFGGDNNYICNGYGIKVLRHQLVDHYQHCEISKLRNELTEKTKGKAVFTKVR